MLLHIGGASTASIVVSIVVIFFFIFAMSFAFGPIPEGGSILSADRFAAWMRASLPRLAVAAAFAVALGAGALFLGNDGDDGDNAAGTSSCDTPLSPFTGNPVTDTRLVTAIDGWQQMASAARADDIDRVRTLYYTTDAHNLTHDIDRPLRGVDEDLARDLCLAVIVIENQMATGLDTEVIAREADRVADFLEQARPDLALIAAPGPSPAGDLCAKPLGAVTDQPLTAERLQAAVDSFRQITTSAVTAPPAETRTLFFGDAHNITHDIDGPLRQADAELATELCQSVLALEEQLPGDFDAATVAAHSETSAERLEEAGRVLGILR